MKNKNTKTILVNDTDKNGDDCITKLEALVFEKEDRNGVFAKTKDGREFVSPDGRIFIELVF